jgi:hypothetical protein
MQARNLNAIRQTFEEHGIEFLGLDGVRLLPGFSKDRRKSSIWRSLWWINSKPASLDHVCFWPQQTSDEPKLGAEFRLGMNGLLSQCCRLCLRSWRDTTNFMKRHS